MQKEIMKIVYEDKLFDIQNVISKTQEIDVCTSNMITDKTSEKKILKKIQIQRKMNEKIILDESRLFMYLTNHETSYNLIHPLEYSFIHNKEGENSLILIFGDYNINNTLYQSYPEGEICNYYDFIRIAKALAKSICQLHLNGITHNDICPKNIGYDSQTGFVQLLNIEPSTSCFTQIHYPRKDLKYISLEIIEQEENLTFEQRCLGDIWGYSLTMFRIANGFDYIASNTMGGIIKSLTQHQFRKSRHPNEKINDFLEFMIVPNVSLRPTIFDILAYIDREHPYSIRHISPFSDEFVIVNRVIRSLNFDILPNETSDTQTEYMIQYLFSIYPLTTTQTSHDRIHMLSEFFNITSSNHTDSIHIHLLVEHINNKLLSASFIQSLHYAFKLVQFVVRYQQKHVGNETFRKEILKLVSSCKDENRLFIRNVRTAWQVISPQVMNNHTHYEFINKFIAQIIQFLSSKE